MNGVARLNVNLPDDLHRDAKAEAAYADQTLAEFVTEAVRASVEEAKRARLQRNK